MFPSIGLTFVHGYDGISKLEIQSKQASTLKFKQPLPRQPHHEVSIRGWPRHSSLDMGLVGPPSRSLEAGRHAFQRLSLVSSDSHASSAKTPTIDRSGQGIKEQSLLPQLQQAFVKVLK